MDEAQKNAMKKIELPLAMNTSTNKELFAELIIYGNTEFDTKRTKFNNKKKINKIPI